ncbi:MAG: hypothetical protein E7538_01585 [Ruminococcaceae bacterium]|nr:hypothetical protein [Oscillospiraceae bacterium]
MAKTINKIIYFDKETIRNILQEQDHGELSKTIDISSSVQNEGSVSAEASAKLKLDVPLISRISFLFSGKIDASYMIKRDSTTTISSTEISEFEKLKPLLVPISNVQLTDIENSSTSLRVAGGYLKIVKGGVDGLDTKEFKTVMDSYDGYDTYKVDDKRYVRFNNTAFVSNYKRNDLLSTTMNLFCIPVGSFDKERFDFMKEIGKMERLISTAEQPQTLSELYPPTTPATKETKSDSIQESETDKITLYDVLYACVSVGDENGR